MGLFTIKSFDKLFSLPNDFHLNDFRLKNKKSLRDLLLSLNFLTKTSTGLAKTESFLSLQTTFYYSKNYDFVSLFLSFEILKSLNISKDDPDGNFKERLKEFATNTSVLIHRILFSSGFLFIKGNKYSLTPLATLIIVRPDSEEKFIQNLAKFLDKEVNQIFLSSLKSLKLNPKHVVVSNDFSISFTTKWVQNYFTKLHMKKLFKRIIDGAFKPTEISFEGDRSSGQKKAFITIFPILQ